METLTIFRDRSLGERLDGMGQMISATLATAAGFRRGLALDHGSGPGLSREDVRRTRLRVMYAAGGLGGLLASRFVNPDQGRAFHLRFHDLLALWSNNIIAWDEAMDAKELSREASLELLSRSILAIVCARGRMRGEEIPEVAEKEFERLFAGRLRPPAGTIFYPATAEFRFENHALACGIRLGRVIEALGSGCVEGGVQEVVFEEARRDFYSRCIALHHAQLTSLEQREVDEQHEWPWYSDSLLDQKFNNILLAPLKLFIPLRHPVERRDQIGRGLLLIGALFFHRQAIDDVLDIASDSEEGLVGAPGYILSSQGTLARDLAPYFPAGGAPRLDGVRDRIVARVQRSRLLDRRFSAWTRLRAARGWKAEHVEQCSAARLGDAGLELLVVRALANRDGQTAEAAGVLVARAAELHRRYRGAMEQRDSKSALQALLESGAAHRILSTVEDPEHQAGIEQELRELDHPRLRPPLGLYYRRCLNSYRAACRNLSLLEQRAES